MFSQAHGSRGVMTGPLSKHKLEPLKTQRVSTQHENRKSNSVHPKDKKAGSKVNKPDDIWNVKLTSF